MEWKWTKGESYEKSKRAYNNNSNNSNNTLPEEPRYGNQMFVKELEHSAYSSSLNYDENTWGILNDSIATNGFKISNKREDLDTKMADREMIQQIGINPFLSNTNYADDISIRDQFLKPVNTTEGRIKTENDETYK